MNLFGCKFCSKQNDGVQRCERKNFDSLLWATITVFQILTQEDWNEVLYSGMDRTSSWAALYFIALMTFGNYVLFNLLVAILVEGFSTEDEPRRPLTDRIIEDAMNAIKEEARSRDFSNHVESRNESRMLEVNDDSSHFSARSKPSSRDVYFAECLNLKSIFKYKFFMLGHGVIILFFSGTYAGKIEFS